MLYLTHGLRLGAAIIYYAVVLPPITTVAHLAAIILGMLVLLCSVCCLGVDSLIDRRRDTTSRAGRPAPATALHEDARSTGTYSTLPDK